jgi:hypothetical protein
MDSHLRDTAERIELGMPTLARSLVRGIHPRELAAIIRPITLSVTSANHAQ